MNEIQRLHLAWLRGDDGRDWPVHGFVVRSEAAAILVDTGVGAPEQVLSEWRVVNRRVADALAEADLSPADISFVVNTHLHFDHCGQNAVFAHAPIFVQRAELERARREESEVSEWFDFAGAKYELLDGDADLLPGVAAVATPGHTSGHQCLIVQTGLGREVLIGDAAYNSRVFGQPDVTELPAGQAADRSTWLASLERLKAMNPRRVHYCHDPIVTVGTARQQGLDAPPPGAATTRQ